MTDRRTTRDDTKETWSRVSKLSQDKFKAKKYSKGRKQPQSPLLGTSLYYRKDFETPKHRSRIRFNGSSTGDSPSEAEAVQDIIWDASSPPPMCNGKGAGESARFVEISDIVNRIAPNDEKPVDRDLVLQWIGDVPCTPEIQQPRVRRISARRQSNNVEDLMKLAKQFDMNMTRQDEERHRERRQDGETGNTEGLNNLDKSSTSHIVLEDIESSAGAQASFPVKSERLSHEEELHALFDGPTQHVSGRLSPPSVNCSQESSTELAAPNTKRPDSADRKNVLEDAAKVPKPDFDDDWENDDLLNDSFVLEMTQNPELLSSAPKTSSLQTGSNPSTLGPQANATVNTGTGQQLPTTSPDPAKTENSQDCQAQAQTSSSKWQQVVTAFNFDATKRDIEGSRGVGAKQSGSPAGASEKDFKTLDSVWGNGDDDDDLLYQACDDVERISSSQEQRKQNNSTIITSNKPTGYPHKAPLSADATCSSNISANNKTVQPGQLREHRQPARVFGRSHSIPGASSAYGSKQNLCETTQTSRNPQHNRQYRFTQMKNASRAVLNPQWTTAASQEASMHSPSAENSSNSHHSTFKRHQSDPVALSNKVFVAAQPVVKCTAAEIERKKREALARRRLRLQASQKPGAPT